MKFNLNQDAVIDGAIGLISLAVGFAVSGAATNLISEDLKPVSKAGITGAGLLINSGLSKDKSTTGAILRGIALGAAAKQGYDMVTGMLSDSITVAENPTLAQKAMYGAMGLACPDCDNARPFLAAPTINFPTNDVVVEDTVQETPQMMLA